MRSGNPYAPPVKSSAVKRLRHHKGQSRNWVNCTLRTAAGIGLGSLVFGLNSGPRGIPIWGVVGLVNGLLVTSIVFAIAGKIAGSWLTNDRLALLGGACGYLSVLVFVLYVSGGALGGWTFLVSGVYSIGAIVGGWLGCLSATEPGERKRLRETVARLSKRHRR